MNPALFLAAAFGVVAVILCVVLIVYGIRMLLRNREERRGGEWGFLNAVWRKSCYEKELRNMNWYINHKLRFWKPNKPAIFPAIFNPPFLTPSPARDEQDLASMQPFNKGRRAPQNVYVAAKDLRPGSIYIPETQTPDDPEPGPENPPAP